MLAGRIPGVAVDLAVYREHGGVYRPATAGADAGRYGALLALATLLCAGCATTRAPLRDAFPLGSVAAPWTLQGEVWTGSFEEAAAAIGDDADTWRRFGPQQAWLAVYCHETEPENCLKVRCVSFATPADAQQAYEHLQPLEISPFRAGDSGCWTEIGVLFRWRRLVFDIFGDRATWGCQVQASYLSAIITKQMPAGAPDDPR